jgi:4-aminobutyrate aminotransferase-like enzyme
MLSTLASAATAGVGFPASSLLVLSAGDDVVRLAPPLTIDDSDVANALAILSDVLME